MESLPSKYPPMAKKKRTLALTPVLNKHPPSTERKINYMSHGPQRGQALILVVIIFCLLFLPQSILGEESGSLTIYTIPDTWSKYVAPGKYCESSKLSLRIDNGDTVEWPRKQRIEVKDLALDRSHLVIARCAGKPLQAARFKFSDYKSTHVCVSYDPYDGIDLFDYTMQGWGCKQASPTDPN